MRAGVSQWTRTEIRRMHPWLPTCEVDRLVAALCPDNVAFERPPRMVKIWPRRPPRVVPEYERDRSPEGIQYMQARTEQAFLLYCEGAKLDQIGWQLGVGKPRAWQIVNAFARKLKWAMRETKFYFVEDGQ